MLIGILAFIAGMLAGWLSLRALGWMVLCFGLLVASDGWAGTVGLSNPPDPGPCGNYPNYHYRFHIYDHTGVQCAAGGVYQGLGDPYYPPLSPDNGPPYCVHIYACSDIAGDNADTFGSTNGCYNACGIASGTVIYTCTGGSPPCYWINGCWTNATLGIVGFYVDCSDGFKTYSGPLAPNQSYCVSHTNCTQWFTTTIEMVFLNNDGGTNTVKTAPPLPPTGTNGVGGGPVGGPVRNPDNPYNPTGPDGGTNAPPPGSGSNTNLTGGQFISGISNLIGVIQGGDIVADGLLGQIVKNTSGTNDQIDYRGYLITLTNQGQGHLTLAQVLTNLAGQTYTQIVQVSAISQTNFAWITNDYSQATNKWNQVTNGLDPGGIQAAASNSAVAFGNSFQWTTGDGTNTAGQSAATNFGSVGYTGNPFILPIHTNTVGAPGAFNVDFTQTAMWQAVCPWVRLAIGFGIFLFATMYIQTRIQEEMIRLQLVPTLGFSAGAIAAKVGKAVLSVSVIATLIGSLPLLVGPAISYVTGRFQSWLGFVPVSPLSDTGMATAGAYTNAIHLGYTLLKAMFPFEFAVETMIYLFFFDVLATGVVLSAQRIQKLLS